MTTERQKYIEIILGGDEETNDLQEDFLALLSLKDLKRLAERVKVPDEPDGEL